MNDVFIKNSRESIIKYQNGDIFQSTMSGNYYLLSKVKNKYIAICLQDGVFWSDPENTPEAAADGLMFIGRNMKIELTHSEK